MHCILRRLVHIRVDGLFSIWKTLPTAALLLLTCRVRFVRLMPSMIIAMTMI